MNKKYLYILFTLLFLSIVFNVILLIKFRQHTIADANKELAYANFYKGYTLLSDNVSDLPLDSNQDPDRILLHFVPLKEKLVKNMDIFGYNQNTGLYIQDANTGAWLGINENNTFVPASLLKVPIAIAIYKNYELGMISLDDQLIVRAEDIDAEAGVPERYTVGNSYKVKDLLEWMLKISDNTAKNILKGSLEAEDLNSVFTHVGIPNPYLATSDNQNVTPRQYSRMFKALYFSTYLKPDNSQALLNLLTDTRVEGLLSAKLPWEIQVSHKYGERSDSLHDCGIVYNKKNPYFICIMTSNVDIAKSRDMITDLSLEVFNYFNKDK